MIPRMNSSYIKEQAHGFVQFRPRKLTREALAKIEATCREAGAEYAYWSVFTQSGEEFVSDSLELALSKVVWSELIEFRLDVFDQEPNHEWTAHVANSLGVLAISWHSDPPRRAEPERLATMLRRLFEGMPKSRRVKFVEEGELGDPWWSLARPAKSLLDYLVVGIISALTGAIVTILIVGS